MQAALNDGKPEEYAMHKERREKLEASITDIKNDAVGQRVYRIRESAKAEIYKRWNAYKEAYNKEFIQKREAYKEERRALCENYLELVRMQNEYIKFRDEFIDFKAKNQLYDNDAPYIAVEMLEDKNVPEIDFLEKGDKPGYKYSIEKVVKRGMSVDDEELRSGDRLPTDPFIRGLFYN